MAEVIGIVASGISIAQLTVQIAKSIIKLKDCWDQVKDAPDEISYLIQDLPILNGILYEMEPKRPAVYQGDMISESEAFRHSLFLCRQGSLELNHIAEMLGSEISSTNKLRRARGSLKVVIKKEQIKRCKARLKGAVQLLSLSHQCYIRAITQLQFEVLFTALPRNESTRSMMQTSSTLSKPAGVSIVTAVSPPVTVQNARFSGGSAMTHLGSPMLGTVEILQHQARKAKQAKGSRSCQPEFQMLARYLEPAWLSHRAWQFRCDRSHFGWNFNLTTYNIVPNSSRQFSYAKSGQLAKLQAMIVDGRASIYDLQRDGTSLLSIAALFGQIDTCKWLLEQGAHTEHVRFGSILNKVLYYGSWISFQQGLPHFEVARLLQQKEELDIFDCAEDHDGRCAFYGRKEVLSWLIDHFHSRGYKHTDDDYIRLVLNISRNVDHNGSELVKLVLSKLAKPHTALLARDQDDITLLHRISSRISGSIENRLSNLKSKNKVMDEGFEASACRAIISKQCENGWRTLLRSFKLEQVDLHVVNWVDATPLTMGFRTLVQVWVGSNSCMIQALSDFLNAWLSDLSSLEVSLLRYGEEEKRLQSKGAVSKDFSRHIKGKGFKTIQDNSYGTLRLINFEPSESPGGWKLWWSEPTDEFAGDFWRICERILPGT